MRGHGLRHLRAPRPARSATSLALLAAALLVAGGAAAPRAARAEEDGFHAHTFNPTADGLGIHGIDGAEVLPEWVPHVSLWWDHANDPIEVGSKRRVLDDLVDEMDVLTLAGAVGLPFDLTAGVTIPLVIHQRGTKFAQPGRDLDGAGFMDVRFDLKWKAYVAPGGGFAVAAKAFATAPAGRDSRMRGEGSQWTAGGLAVAEYRAPRFRVMARAGFQWIEEEIEFGGARADDRILVGPAGAFTIYRQGGYEMDEERDKVLFRPFWQLDAEGSVDLAWRASDYHDETMRPAEALLGLRLYTPIGVSVAAGGGAGLSLGIGAPDWRLFVGLAYDWETPFAESWRFVER